MNSTAPYTLLFCAVLLSAGCASAMTPRQFNTKLPKVTASKFYERVSVGDAISKEECRLLIANRKYTAPVATTVSGDLKNAARGIDEWVRQDGGNAYSVVNYEWIRVDHEATQLTVHFDTLQCK